MTKIKICGIKTIEASKIAANEGADYIGLVFVDGVRRKISINKAIEISNYINSLRVAPKIVGLFQNQHLNYVLDIIKNINLDCVQLCGNENEDFISNIDVKIFKQLRVKNTDKKLEIKSKINNHLNMNLGVILDTYKEGSPGGTGESFDWNLISGIASKENTFLGGGLNINNIEKAITNFAPWGVDVSTGVEYKGEKNINLISSFIKKVRFL